MADKNLEEMLKPRNPVEMLRNSQIGAYVYPVVPVGILATGATSRWPGARPRCCSTSRTTWPR